MILTNTLNIPQIARGRKEFKTAVSFENHMIFEINGSSSFWSRKWKNVKFKILKTRSAEPH